MKNLIELLIVVYLLLLSQIAVSQGTEEADRIYHAELMSVLDKGVVNSRMAIAEDSGIFTGI